jgi:hypothetical protein
METLIHKVNSNTENITAKAAATTTFLLQFKHFVGNCFFLCKLNVLQGDFTQIKFSFHFLTKNTETRYKTAQRCLFFDMGVKLGFLQRYQHRLMVCYNRILRTITEA